MQMLDVVLKGIIFVARSNFWLFFGEENVRIIEREYRQQSE